MSRPLGAVSGGYHTKKTFKPHRPVVYPHAILSADKQVLGIKKYPLSSNSTAVVPIPDGLKIQIGDYFNPATKSFQKDPPDA